MVALMFIVLTMLNYIYFRHNVQMIIGAMRAVSGEVPGGGRPTDEDWADADSIVGPDFTPRITLDGELRWLLGREVAIILVCGNAIVLVRNRFR